MAALLLTPRATQLMYYGEEIGMRTTPPARKEDVQDPIGKIGWPEEKGRDGERTPMQWDKTKNAGFSPAERTWLPEAPSAAEYNVEAESRDQNSILSFCKRVLALRRTEPALQYGSYVALDGDNPFVLSFLRKSRTKGDSILVVLNMSAVPRTITLDLASQGIKESSAKPLLAAPQLGPDATVLAQFAIPAFGVFIGAVH
jgi:alpha-glucosidase